MTAVSNGLLFLLRFVFNTCLFLLFFHSHQISLQSGANIPDSNPVIQIFFTIAQYALSGLRINRLDMQAEVSATFLSHQ